MDGVEQAIARAEAALRDAAREHKRLERQHRLEARHLMQVAADFRATCQALGLEFVVVPKGTDKESEPDGEPF